MGAYETALKQLNSAQMQAVRHIDGPLLVVAGPGTGKTQLLSTRVAHILHTTDTSPAHILCVTFTNKAALNMRERMLSITDGAARDVVIKTFHSFAAEIMNMYPDYFWNGARLRVVPDAVKQEILQDILATLPLKNPLALKFYGRFTATSDVLQGMRLAKEAGLTPEKLASLIQANLAYIDVVEPELVRITEDRLSSKKLDQLRQAVSALPADNIDDLVSPLLSLSTILQESLVDAVIKDEQSGKTTNCGKWKARWVQTVNGKRCMATERRRNEWWLALADVYGRYRDDLHARGYYDYSDMLVEVITQLEQNPELLAEVQERFIYVMIDEFQDTNAAQLRLAQLVSDHPSAEGNPNIMAVGDDDQSIFKFNGAELDNMLYFQRHYPRAQTVILTENYRSNQSILDLSMKVTDQAHNRLVYRNSQLQKKLNAQIDAPKGRIEHKQYTTQDEQIFGIAELVSRSFHPQRSVAVIARNHSSLQRIAAVLLANRIPLHYEQQRNLLDHPLVEHVQILAETLEAINGGDVEEVNVCVSRLLRQDAWRVDAEELWGLARTNLSKPDWLGSLSRHSNKKLQLYAQLLMELAAATYNTHAHIAIEYILGLRAAGGLQSPLIEYFTGRQNHEASEYLTGLSAIRAIRSHVDEFAPQTQATLQDFVSFIKLERASGAVITDDSPFVTGAHAVHLLTVHKAKGLEFDDVFVIDVVESMWQPHNGGRKAPANLPLQPVGDDMDDYVRMLFVAVSRSKQNLTISSFSVDMNGKECLPSPLISTILPAQAASARSKPEHILQQSLRWPRLSSNNERQLLLPRLESYTLSVTHLLNFLDVTRGGPAYYLERNLLRLPELKTPQLSYGSAVHTALEVAQRLVNAGSFSLTEVVNAFSSALEHEHLPEAEFERYRLHGELTLKKLFADNFLGLHSGSLAEQTITDVSVGKARLAGTLDRLDIADRSITVSDYKTGTPLAKLDSVSGTTAVKAWKQRTQLVFYALLLRHSSRFPHTGKKIIGQMLYIEADTHTDLCRSYEPNDDELHRLELLVRAVWNRIMALDLPDISSYETSYKGIVAFEEQLIQEITAAP